MTITTLAPVEAHSAPEKGVLELRWADGTAAGYPYLWLRDNCPSARHPSTQERIIDLTRIDPEIAPISVRLADGAVEIEWPDRQSRYDLDWLRAHRPGVPVSDPAAIGAALWRGDLGAEGVPRFEAGAVMASDAALLDWMQATRRLGFSILTGLADDVEAGMAAARRIGFLRETNFGTTFAVVSMPNPNNAAYTADRLPLHTDLSNQELPPGFQFLHCLANEAEGGGSLFVDGFAIAEDLRIEEPEAYRLLSTVTIPFRFHDAGFDIRRRQRVIREDGAGAIEEICFNDSLADVFDLPEDLMAAYYGAYRAYMLRTRQDRYLVTLRLEAGEMVVFDNRRVLHGRDAFDPATGRRHLHGCYVDRGEFESRIRVVSRSL